MVGSNLYRFLIKNFDPLVPQKLLPLWNHPAGPKTVFFWAPTVKWVNNVRFACKKHTMHENKEETT